MTGHEPDKKDWSSGVSCCEMKKAFVNKKYNLFFVFTLAFKDQSLLINHFVEVGKYFT